MKALAAVVIALAALGVWYFFYTAPTPPPGTTEAEIAQIEAEAKQAITDRWAGYLDIAQAKDVEGWMSYWAPDIRILEPGMDRTGDEFFESGREFWEGGAEVFSLDLESFEIWVHGDVAYQIGQYDEAFQFPGEEPAEIQNYFFARWEKQTDGMWRINRLMAGPRDAPSEG